MSTASHDASSLDEPSTVSHPGQAPPGTGSGSGTTVDEGGASSATAVADGDTAARAAYLAQVMADIDAEVARRRASGDLPAGLERQLDELFLEFSPMSARGTDRLREQLAVVDAGAFVDIAVPVASNKAVGSALKRLIRSAISWYVGFIVHQIVKFGWSVSRLFHLVVEEVEDLSDRVDALGAPDLPEGVRVASASGTSWWADEAATALSGVVGRVLVADCGDGSLVGRLVRDGVDAYGLDPSEHALEEALAEGLDVREGTVLDHLGVVGGEALAGMVLDGSVQWLRPNDRLRLVDLVADRLAVGGVLVLHSAAPEGWERSVGPVVADLAPGRPVHPETWEHLLESRDLVVRTVKRSAPAAVLERLPADQPAAAVVNAAVDAVEALASVAGDYVVVAVRAK
ncbi:MAG: methionine biosynthesis protein MetW [Acidimicrobiales bacterium]